MNDYRIPTRGSHCTKPTSEFLPEGGAAVPEFRSVAAGVKNKI